MINKTKYESGNILVSSLLMMIAMNLMAVTLVQTSLREFKTADFKTIDSSTFYLAESCINDSIKWLKGNDNPPTALPYTISRTDISNLYDGTESQQTVNALSKYSYNCSTSSITVKSVEGDTAGTGDNVGTKDSYGISGNLRPSYYYRISSNGNGPSGTIRNVTTIISAKY